MAIPPVPATRCLYVRKADITAYGPSPSCPGCVELVLATKRAVAHSPECRARIEAAMLASGNAVAVRRVEEARRRSAAPSTMDVDPTKRDHIAASSSASAASSGAEPETRQPESNISRVETEMEVTLVALGVCAIDGEGDRVHST